MTAEQTAAAPRHVVVPGIWNSGPEHWQTSWEHDWNDRVPGSAVRIEPASWDHPDRDDWVRAIDVAVQHVGAPVVLVAHSLGCLAVTAWLEEHDDGAAGAFLVASPDPETDEFPAAATGFRMPHGPVSTPTVLVASRDDEYCAPDRAATMARTLGAELVDVGALGHVNVASGVGEWAAGRDLLTRFESSLRVRSALM